MLKCRSRIIVGALVVAVIVGGVFYFKRSEKTKNQGGSGAENSPVPTRILINTSAESTPTIAGEMFITDSWKHVSEAWFQKNAGELKKYPEIKEAQTILEEKLNGIPEEKLKETIEENNLQNFAQGLKDASELYHEPLPEIADKILKIVPYGK